MEREKKDPFLVGEPRSNTDDSLENYSFGPVKLETLEPFRTGTTDALAALGTLESPNALPLFAWPQAANIMDDMDQQEASALYGRIAAEQASSTVMAMPPSAPSLSVEQYYGAARADTGSSSDFPLPAGGGAVGLGLAPSALSLSLPRGDSDDSDNFSDMSSDRSAMTSPFLVREGSGNFLQLPGKRPSESALFNSMSYENLSARAAQMVPPEYYHDAAGLLATTVPRSASPQLIMMTSPLIRAIPSPSMSPSPSPALSPGGMSPLASQISMVDLDQQMNSFSPAEEALAQLIKLESSYAGSTSFDAGLSAVGQRPSSSELTVPKPRKRQSSASDRDEGPERPGRQARQTLYGCPYPNCGKSFTRPYNLKSHYRSHTGERPYACSNCTLTFSRKHDLKRHEKLHTGAKPFTCIACNKSFARSDALSRHLKSEPGKESPCVVRINLMNAKEKLAIAQARDDETTSHDSGALMDYTSPPEIMGAPSPAYSGVAGPFLASGQIFAVPTPQGVNYYQALPPGFPAPQFVPQQVPAEAYQDESLLNMLQQLQQQPRSPQGSR